MIGIPITSITGPACMHQAEWSVEARRGEKSRTVHLIRRGSPWDAKHWGLSAWLGQASAPQVQHFSFSLSQPLARAQRLSLIREREERVGARHGRGLALPSLARVFAPGLGEA